MAIDNEFTCILCGYSKYKSLKKGVRDSYDVEVVSCNSCNHIQLYPLPTEEEEKDYYDKNKQEKSLFSNRILDEKSIERNMPWIEQQIERYSQYIFKSKDLLEIGAGYGTFLAELRKRYSKKCQGIEISAEKRYFAEKYVNEKLYELNLLSDEIPSDMKHKYDLIVSFHVLEHIIMPNLFLQKVKELLCDGGKCIFEVPNVDERFAKECKEYEQFKYLRAHISYFSKECLCWLFKTNGFSEIEVKGVQNYSVENSLHWMRNGSPSLDKVQINHPENLEWINRIYKDILEKEMAGDALMVVAKK